MDFKKVERKFVCSVCNKEDVVSMIELGSESILKPLSFLCDDCEKEIKKNEEVDKIKKEKDVFDKQTKWLSENIVECMAKSSVPLRYCKAKITDFDEDVIKKINLWFDSGGCDTIVIQGKVPGNGKTHLACAIIAESIIKTHKKALFISAVEMMLNLKGSFNSEQSESEKEIISKLSETPLLVVDDLGCEKSSEYAQSVVYHIINSRYVDMLPTIITTNTTSADIIDRNGERVLSRMMSGVIIVLNGKDQRKQRATTEHEKLLQKGVFEKYSTRQCYKK